MEAIDMKEQTPNQVVTAHDLPVIKPSQGDVVIPPPAAETPCPTCATGAGSTPLSFVYALGKIEARFPRLSVEKEFA